MQISGIDLFNTTYNIVIWIVNGNKWQRIDGGNRNEFARQSVARLIQKSGRKIHNRWNGLSRLFPPLRSRGGLRGGTLPLSPLIICSISLIRCETFLAFSLHKQHFLRQALFLWLHPDQIQPTRQITAIQCCTPLSCRTDSRNQPHYLPTGDVVQLEIEMCLDW